MSIGDRQTSRHLRRDILSAYIVTASRIGSWVILSALIMRWVGPEAFALLALVRATLGVLNYAAVGLSPALIHALAQALSRRDNPSARADESLPILYGSGAALAWVAGSLAGAGLLGFLSIFSSALGGVGSATFTLILLLGLGVVIRLFSDAMGAILQTHGRITHDNAILSGAEIIWAVVAAAALVAWRSADWATSVGGAYVLASAGMLVARVILARQAAPRWSRPSAAVCRRLLLFGTLVMLTQLADYLYAPTDFLLIRFLIDPLAVADYAPAVQIDSGLLLLAAALGSVLLPVSALAHSHGKHESLRRYYVRGTVLIALLLSGVSVLVYLLGPQILRLWLGRWMPVTVGLLPLVLVNTIVGGSGMVGRAVLIGMGRIGPYTASVLIAAAINVLLSLLFIRAGWGLNGVILGTVIATLGRCAVWMPWYVLRALRASTPTSGGRGN